MYNQLAINKNYGSDLVLYSNIVTKDCFFLQIKSSSNEIATINGAWTHLTSLQKRTIKSILEKIFYTQISAGVIKIVTWATNSIAFTVSQREVNKKSSWG